MTDTMQPAFTSDPAVHLARANVYRWLAAATLPPSDRRTALLRDDSFRAVGGAALEWMRVDPLFRPDSLGPGELSPGELDPSLPAPDGEKPGTSYVRVFGHSISKSCPPYELEYYPNRDINFRSQRLADIAGFYRAFALDRAEAAKERVDHLSFQAEFMQIAIARELYAREHDLEAKGHEKAELCRRAQRLFFAEHLGWWLPAFGALLAERDDAPFYRRLGLLVRAFVAVERAVLGVPPFNDFPEVRADTYEGDGGCFDCGVNAAPATSDGTEPSRGK